MSIDTSSVEQLEYIVQTLGGNVTQVGGAGDGNPLTQAADFIGPVTSATGLSVTVPDYIFASMVVASDLSGNSEPGNLPQVVLGTPTDLTFTAPGSGGPDGTNGDGSLVMGSAGNFITVAFGTDVSATECEARALILFTNTAGNGDATVELLSGGTPVASLTTTIPGGPAQSGLGGVIFTVNALTFDAVRVSRFSGTVEIDAIAVAEHLGSGSGPGAECGDGYREGGEECDDGNSESNDGCSSECRTEANLILGSQFCTLSQGGWGAPGGIGNGSEGFVTRYPGVLPFTIGGPERSTTVHTQDALIEYMPRGGKPRSLSNGERNFYSAGDVGDDGGGVLSGQTSALTLAVNLSHRLDESFGELDEMVLPSVPFCTQPLSAGTDGLLGTADDELDAGAPVSGPWALPENVAVANRTVGDVLVMANQYLWGAFSAASISEVNDAVETLIMAFHECRRVVECP